MVMAILKSFVFLMLLFVSAYVVITYSREMGLGAWAGIREQPVAKKHFLLGTLP